MTRIETTLIKYLDYLDSNAGRAATAMNRSKLANFNQAVHNYAVSRRNLSGNNTMNASQARQLLAAQAAAEAAKKQAAINKKAAFKTLRNEEYQARQATRSAANRAAAVARSTITAEAERKRAEINRIHRLTNQTLNANLRTLLGPSATYTSYAGLKALINAVNKNKNVKAAYLNKYREVHSGKVGVLNKIARSFRGPSVGRAKAGQGLARAGQGIRSAFGGLGNRLRTTRGIGMRRTALLGASQGRVNAAANAAAKNAAIRALAGYVKQASNPGYWGTWNAPKIKNNLNKKMNVNKKRRLSAQNINAIIAAAAITNTNQNRRARNALALYFA